MVNFDRIVNRNGHFISLPKSIINGLYYRGQSTIFEEYNPSLFWSKTAEEQFLERINLCEFSILIRKHPSFRLFAEGYGTPFNNGHVESHEMFIDEEALAQHYGILTEHIDLTADKWMAALFACTNSHRTPSGERDDYVKHIEQDSGVFYLYQGIHKKLYSGKLHPIGLQPFSRPVH